MSEVRRQVLIAASPEVVWSLLTDVERHPDWWPDVIETKCDDFHEGCVYREMTKVPLARVEREFLVEGLEEPSEFRIRCLKTGTFVSMAIAEAQGQAFVDAAAGMDPLSNRFRVLDALTGRRTFGRWLDATLESLGRVARERGGSQ